MLGAGEGKHAGTLGNMESEQGSVVLGDQAGTWDPAGGLPPLPFWSCQLGL